MCVCSGFNFQAVTLPAFLILNQFMLTRTSAPLCLVFVAEGRCKRDGHMYDEWCLFFGAENERSYQRRNSARFSSDFLLIGCFYVGRCSLAPD